MLVRVLRRTERSTVPSKAARRNRQNVPSLDPRQFETLRWNYHNTLARARKSPLNVSRLPVEILQHKNFARPHRLLRQCPYNCYEDAFLLIIMWDPGNTTLEGP
jgi:hypothetical protein